ncbi:MAG: hypothetical protein LBM75_02930 [Myxococcales bacterium]|jgi:hypothetical protein|nr:hypothetical protein [Myxococcales bacterium]
MFEEHLKPRSGKTFINSIDRDLTGYCSAPLAHGVGQLGEMKKPPGKSPWWLFCHRGADEAAVACVTM